MNCRDAISLIAAFVTRLRLYDIRQSITRRSRTAMLVSINPLLENRNASVKRQNSRGVSRCSFRISACQIQVHAYLTALPWHIDAAPGYLHC